jgi:MraZ protein
MALFFGTHQNKLDAKGRVSIPAPFRTVLKKRSHAGEGSPTATVYLRRSHKFPCIEGWTELGFEELSERLASGHDQYSPEHEDIMIAMFGDVCAVETDREGRILLPAELVEHAVLNDNVTFIGARNIFQIWEPAAARQRQAEAREQFRKAQLTIPVGPSA